MRTFGFFGTLTLQVTCGLALAVQIASARGAVAKSRQSAARCGRMERQIVPCHLRVKSIAARPPWPVLTVGWRAGDRPRRRGAVGGGSGQAAGSHPAVRGPRESRLGY